MNRIFGVAGHSMLTVQTHLAKHKKNIVLLNYNLKRLRSKRFRSQLTAADIVLVDSMRTFNSALPVLNKSNSVVTVFDNPLLLQKQPDIKLLDVPNVDNPVQFAFTIQPIDYQQIIIATKQKSLPHEVLRDTSDTLASIIKNYSAAGLLDKFNSYLYQATTPITRPAVRHVLVQYIFGEIKLPDLTQRLQKHGGKNSVKLTELLKPIIDYMQSGPGQQLQKALAAAIQMENAASKTARRTIAYKKLAEQHNVDKFELRNLILLYRNYK